jgi:hypothetical protein
MSTVTLTVSSQVTREVDTSGATDVTAVLAAVIAEAAPGTVIDLGGGSFRCDKTLTLTGLAGITLTNGTIWTDDPTGDSSTLAAPSRQARDRSHVRLVGCTDVTCDLTIRGANAQGGTGDAAYVEALEAQHGYDVQGGSGNTVTGEVSYVYGDCAYVGRNAAHTVVYVHGHHQGRQGVAVAQASGVTIRGSLHDIRRTVIDLEPAKAEWVVQDVLIDGLVVGSHRLTGIAAASSVGVVRDVTVRNVTETGSQTLNMVVGNGSNPARQGPWDIESITMSGKYGSLSPYYLRFTNVDGLSVHGTDMVMTQARGMSLVGVRGCTAVDVTGNRVRTRDYKGVVREPGDATELVEF